jgi:hypothetical protein
MSKKAKTRNIYDTYGYGSVNGIEQYGRFEPTDDGKDREFVGYGRYIAIEGAYKDIDGGSPILTIGFDTLDGARETINMRRETMSKKKDVQAILLKANADAYDSSLSVLMNCLRVSEDTAKRGQCYHRTGWIVEDPGTEERLFFKSSSLVGSSQTNEQAEYVGQYDLNPKGTFDAWKTMVEEWVLGNVALEIGILIGLSPIISCEWGSRNLIFHLMGDSGTGKTSTAILGLSTVGCPNQAETAKYLGADGKPMRSLMSSWKGTSNALLGKLEGLDGTLMVFDELSKVETTDILTSTIYTLSDGADKDRMLSPIEMQSTNVIRTNILSVGEESLLEKANNKNSGLNVRVCEISTDFTSSPEQAEAIVACCYENYGHAAPMFAQYIVENLTYADVAEIRQENLTRYSDALVAAGCQSKTIRRLAEFGAILLTVAEIAEEALDIKFSQTDIIDFLVDQQISTDANTDIGIRAHNALRGFVNSNIGSFITNSSEMWTKSGICLGKIEHPNGGPMEVSIVASEFPKIMSQLGFNNPNLVLQRLKANGYLEHEVGKNYRKRKLTKAGGIVRVNVVIFPQ